MLNTHKTADWKTMFISQMDNDHLANTIKLFLRKIEQCIYILTDESVWSNIDFLLSWSNYDSIKQSAKRTLSNLYEKLGKYVIESNIRGINITDELQATFKRAESVWNSTAKILAIVAIDSDDDDDSDEDEYPDF